VVGKSAWTRRLERDRTLGKDGDVKGVDEGRRETMVMDIKASYPLKREGNRKGIGGAEGKKGRYKNCRGRGKRAID
jgi:hypothetical protein